MSTQRPSLRRPSSLCRLQNQILQGKGAGLGDLGASSHPEGLDAGGMRPEVLTSLQGSFSQLMQGSNPQDFGQGVPHSQEEAWCSSASSQISLPTMQDSTTAAAQQSPAQIDLQVCTPPCTFSFQSTLAFTILLSHPQIFVTSGLLCISPAV